MFNPNKASFVVYKTNQLNYYQSGLATIPACLLQVHLSCIWDNC